MKKPIDELEIKRIFKKKRAEIEARKQLPQPKNVIEFPIPISPDCPDF